MYSSSARRRVLISGIAVLVVAAIVAIPVAVRALPGRYAYYLPGPLQALRHVSHAETLPTPQAFAMRTDGGGAGQGLPIGATQAPPTETATPAPSRQEPTFEATPSGETRDAGQTATTRPATVTAPATPIPTATATRLTSTPSATPPRPTPAIPASYTISGLRPQYQKWNNCGPATLAMLLAYWGRSETQDDIAPVLKPDPEDKNVNPDEMASYANGLGLEAIVRPGGDLTLLKRLVAQGFPVIVETWYVRDAEDQLGHYRLVMGYDDAARRFLTYDSLEGPNIPITYAAFDELWRGFNRLYLVVYPHEREAELAALLGPAMTETAAWENALQTAQAETAQPPGSCEAYAHCSDAATFAWFNVGTSLVGLGRYEEAATAFDRARSLGLHWRMLWYQFGPYQAYLAVGRYDDVVTLADATLRVVPNLEESYYWRGKARLAQGKTVGAIADFQAALRYHKDWAPAQKEVSLLTE